MLPFKCENTSERRWLIISFILVLHTCACINYLRMFLDSNHKDNFFPINVPFCWLTISLQQMTRDFTLWSNEFLLTCWTKTLLPQCLDKFLCLNKVIQIWRIDNRVTAKLKTLYQDILRTIWFKLWLLQLTTRINLLSTRYYYSLKSCFTNSMVCL